MEISYPELVQYSEKDLRLFQRGSEEYNQVLAFVLDPEYQERRRIAYEAEVAKRIGPSTPDVTPKAAAPSGVTKEFLGRQLKTTVRVVGEEVNKKTAALEQRIAELEKITSGQRRHLQNLEAKYSRLAASKEGTK